jgi:eukaryotic-like serine/threonine-protein kinase
VGFLNDRIVERLRSTEAAPDFSATRYHLQTFLARGGMGAVYLADDRTLQRRVAIKVLDAADPDGGLAERLSQEARVLARLEHPGIVPVHDAGVLPDGRVFYVMKFVEGARLDESLAGVHSLPERLRLFLRVCEAVSFAHSRGILHRDLKPSNIMVGAFGEVLVMDWGLAKILAHGGEEDPGKTIPPAAPLTAQHSADTVQADTTQTKDGIVMGTPGYMSPEQAQGRTSDTDARSDIFSLGQLLEFVVLPSKEAAGGRAPKPLRAIYARASAAEPATRYATVGLLAEDISRFLDGEPVSAYRENLLERAQRFYKRYEVAILLIAAYLVMRTLFVLYGRH